MPGADQLRGSRERDKLTIAEVCADLGISRRTFYESRAKGRAPRCITLPNGSLRVRPSEYQHRMVAGRASPDDPALTRYWDQRRRRTRLPVDAATWHLLCRQRGRCPLCRGLLLHADHQPQDPASGSSGTPPRARRSASTRSPP